MTTLTWERVREWRKRRGLTQSQLSTISGVSQATISVIEKGKQAPTAETLYRLARALDVRMEWLVREVATSLPIGGENPEQDDEHQPADQ